MRLISIDIVWNVEGEDTLHMNRMLKAFLSQLLWQIEIYNVSA